MEGDQALSNAWSKFPCARRVLSMRMVVRVASAEASRFSGLIRTL